jgi:hypothetical protein
MQANHIKVNFKMTNLVEEENFCTPMEILLKALSNKIKSMVQENITLIKHKKYLRDLGI